MTIILGCGGGGSSGGGVTSSVGSASSSEGTSGGVTSSVGNNATPNYSQVRVSLGVAYVLDADVAINSQLADIIVDDGQYEWLEYYSGNILSKGGAIDIAEPFGTATSDDLASIMMTAPADYSNVNPFTSLLQIGDEDLESLYPNAAAYVTESGKIFDFNTVEVANAGDSTAILIARETVKALFLLIDKQNSFTRAVKLATEGTFEEIKNCTTLPCLRGIVKKTFVSVTSNYSTECDLLPGLNDCLDYEPIASSSEMSSSSEAVSSSEMSSSSEASSSSESNSHPSNSGNPYP